MVRRVKRRGEIQTGIRRHSTGRGGGPKWAKSIWEVGEEVQRRAESREQRKPGRKGSLTAATAAAEVIEVPQSSVIESSVFSPLGPVIQSPYSVRVISESLWPSFSLKTQDSLYFGEGRLKGVGWD